MAKKLKRQAIVLPFSRPYWRNIKDLKNDDYIFVNVLRMIGKSNIFVCFACLKPKDSENLGKFSLNLKFISYFLMLLPKPIHPMTNGDKIKYNLKIKTRKKA